MLNLTVMETRSMTKKEIEIELGKRTKVLEELGMSHKDAFEFVSGIMNLGIAAEEKSKEKKLEIMDFLLEEE